MTDEKKTKDTKKDAKVKATTAVDLLKGFALKGTKDRAQCVEKALAMAQSRGITKNSKGKTITQDNLSTLLNAMCRDVVNKKKGWWSNTKLEETDTSFRLVSLI